MFCACLGIILCFVVIIVGSVLSAIDINLYNFGLYYVLLAIVALTGAITLCVIRPQKCCGISDPKWYTGTCERLHQVLLNAHEKRLAAYLEATTELGVETHQNDEEAVRRKATVAATRQRTTLLMLGPAVQMMHHVIHGVADNTSTVDEEEQQEDEDVLGLWWDVVTQIDEMEVEQNPPDKKKRKKKRKRKQANRQSQLFTIVTSTADVVVSAQPTVADENVNPVVNFSSDQIDVTNSRGKTENTIDDCAREIFL